ncbi:MAG: excinuclease ABC subunit UvrC [Clostridia bacterium]|nr:excinuclease ABC subunit UvrC [Clostridia bacterium]
MSDFIINDELNKLPKTPGVYLMKNSKGKVIYVGKAINLKNRVSQYFKNEPKYKRTKYMVKAIRSFEYIVTSSERDAFIIECNLIKSHMPRYNVLLKDDKTYPYLKINVNEQFPTIQIVRKVQKDGAKYFGPYPQRTPLKEILNLLQSVFMIRNCSKKDFRKKVRPCLNYHIKRCVGPCAFDVDEKKYMQNVIDLIDLLEGNNETLMDDYKTRMEEAAEKLEFEKAAHYRDRISILRKISDVYMIKPNQKDSDVIAGQYKKGYGLCVVLKVREGQIVAKKEFEFNDIEGYTSSQLTSEFIRQYYQDTSKVPSQIIIYNDIEDKQWLEEWINENNKHNVKLIIPKRGGNQKLAETAFNTASLSLNAYIERQNATYANLVILSKLLKLETIPEHIEAFDISNLSGKDTVGSMVTFHNGKPKKSGYRKFEIKQEVKSDDLMAMKEVLLRRIKRFKDEKFANMPDLIMIDGGTNQTNTIKKLFEENDVDIPVCGMVKDESHRTRGLIYNGKEHDIKEDMELYRFITFIQDEAHRFAIEYNRANRNKNQIQSQLDEISGIGEKKKDLLMKQFGSVREIRGAGIDQLKNVKGISEELATEIFKFFHGGE